MKTKGTELLPIVMFSFLDHSAHLAGQAGPYRFVAVGILLEETPDSYLLGHWVQESPVRSRKKIGDVTTCIVKVKGLKKQVVGHYLYRGTK